MSMPFQKKGKGPGGLSGLQVTFLGKRPQRDTPEVSPRTYDEFGVASHGDDGPVHRPQQLLHDHLHVPLSRALEEDTPLKTDTRDSR